jgi:integrase
VTEPTFGPTKTGESRAIDIGPETVRLLREHRRQQAELKLQNRRTYHDLGLVFAREWADLYRHPDGLGLPLAVSVLGERTFARLTKDASLRPIKFHGLRHTCATLLLQAGAPMKVVQERLGHKKIAITMDTYSHVLPSMQQDATQRLAVLLHGS